MPRKGGLRLNKKYLRTKSPEVPEVERISKECDYCNSIFFGLSKKEVDSRLAKHKCPKK